jgi:hypothetical protein
MFSRAERRHHLARMKAKAKKAGKLWNWKNPEKLANHLAVCSCPMCGNPRKWFHEKTWQEKKFDSTVAERLCDSLQS